MKLQKKKIRAMARPGIEQLIEQVPPLDIYGIATQHLDIKIECFSTPKILGILNAMASSAKRYMEIGSYRGVSLCSAAHGNATECIGIDNFSWPVRTRKANEAKLRERVAKANEAGSNIIFHKGGFEQVVPKLSTRKKVDVLFYDGEHTYDAQTKALEMMLPLLSKNAVIIIDDANGSEVRRSTSDFCLAHGWEIIFERLTNPSPDLVNWWNGIQILMRKR